MVSLQAHGVHGTLHPGHMAVMVGAPHVDTGVEPPGELVAVVGYVCGEIGVDAIGAAQHIVLEVELFYLFLTLAGLAHVPGDYLRRCQPERAVLLIGEA